MLNFWEFRQALLRGVLSIEDLTLDMNRDQWPVRPMNHTYHFIAR